MAYSKGIHLDHLGMSMLPIVTIFPSFPCCELVLDLQFAISNAVYKEYKVLQT